MLEIRNRLAGSRPLVSNTARRRRSKILSGPRCPRYRAKRSGPDLKLGRASSDASALCERPHHHVCAPVRALHPRRRHSTCPSRGAPPRRMRCACTANGSPRRVYSARGRTALEVAYTARPRRCEGGLVAAAAARRAARGRSPRHTSLGVVWQPISGSVLVAVSLPASSTQKLKLRRPVGAEVWQGHA